MMVDGHMGSFPPTLLRVLFFSLLNVAAKGYPSGRAYPTRQNHQGNLLLLGVRNTGKGPTFVVLPCLCWVQRTAGETKGVEPVDVMMRERVEATEDELFRPLPAGRLPADGSWASPSHSGATLPANRFPTFEELEAAARAMEKQEFEGTATKQRQIEEQALAEWGTPVEGTVEIIDGVEVFTTTLPSDSASSRGGPRATKVNGFIGDGGDSLSRAQHSVGKDDWERELLQEMQSEEGSGMGEEGSSEGPEGDEVFDSRFPGLEREDTTTITEVMSFGDAEEERKQE